MEDAQEETDTEPSVSPKKASGGGWIASQIPSQGVWRALDLDLSLVFLFSHNQLSLLSLLEML